AASNQNLVELARSGRFRLDLLYRLNVLSLWLPPLRERAGDPELLARHFVRELSRRYATPEKSLPPATVEWLDRHHWPGNARERENVVRREFLLGDDNAALRIGDDERDSPTATTAEWAYRPARARALMAFDRRFLSELLLCSGGNISQAAKLAGKERRAL